jgi:ATP-binding cassette subfamily B protein
MTPGNTWPSTAAAGEALHAHFGIPAGGWESQDRMLTVEELEAGFAGLAPAVVELPSGESLAVAAEGWIVTPRGPRKARSADLRTLWEEPLREKQRDAFRALPLGKVSAEQVIGRLIRPLPAARVIGFQTPAGVPFSAQLRAAGFLRRALLTLMVDGLAYACILAAWGLIGRAAFSGRWDEGWFWGWGLLLACVVPLDAWAEWQQGWMATALGGLLKQRLLASSLVTDPDLIRSRGAGELLSRVFESDSLESLSLAGGTTGMVAAVEIAMNLAVIMTGTQPLLNTSLLVAWLGVVALMTAQYVSRRRAWTVARLELTGRLEENMTGHRTRVAQQPPALWHEQEDRDLAGYENLSRRLDSAQVRLMVLGPRGWLTIGAVSLCYGFMQGGSSVESAALTLGGVLLGYQALRKCTIGIVQLTAGVQSWEHVRELAGTVRAAEVPRAAVVRPAAQVLDLRNVGFAYRGRENAVLSGVSLSIQKGDRVLLEGPSGSGKSTLGALAAGLRVPTGGIVLSGGLDLATLGELGWRKRVATAPQYHENHVLAAPLLFNLLMGRAWPARPQDIDEAIAVCEELGLGPVLSRMPAGVWEMMGETGWQLSHGERSRVFLARALLQGAELVVLDESFAALDPASLEQCLETVLRRAPGLLVIAHP